MMHFPRQLQGVWFQHAACCLSDFPRPTSSVFNNDLPCTRMTALAILGLGRQILGRSSVRVIFKSVRQRHGCIPTSLLQSPIPLLTIQLVPMAFSFSSFIYTLFFFVFAVQASPLALEARNKLDVFVPHIIEPNSNTVWTIGQEATVIW